MISQYCKSLFLFSLILGMPLCEAKCIAPERGPPGPQGPVGPPGPQGPPGPGFIPDVGSTLSFTNYFEPGGAPPVGSVLTPFVVAPDGTMTLGTPIIADGSTSAFTFDPILVLNPVFGTYHTGVQVTLSGDFSPGVLSLTSQVTSDRAGPSPPENTLVGESDGLATFIFPLLAGDQFQVLADYAYGPTAVP